MSNNCHSKWKRDDRFIRYRLREDNIGPFIPFCTHSGHIGVINEDRYRTRKCEKNGKKPCPYYHRFREFDPKKIVYSETQSIEVTVQQ
jgi:hypothetical protein